MTELEHDPHQPAQTTRPCPPKPPAPEQEQPSDSGSEEWHTQGPQAPWGLHSEARRAVPEEAELHPELVRPRQELWGTLGCSSLETGASSRKCASLEQPGPQPLPWAQLISARHLNARARGALTLKSSEHLHSLFNHHLRSKCSSAVT